jgi:polyisoprenoid-binding protein YceI
MTNYRIAWITIAALFAASCSAAETPAPTSAPKPAAVKPAAVPAAAPAQAATALPHYGRHHRSSLAFSFVQEGAANKGSFKQFATDSLRRKAQASGNLSVKVQMASAETGQDRNELITVRFVRCGQIPVAQYVASSFAKRADGGLRP